MFDTITKFIALLAAVFIFLVLPLAFGVAMWLALLLGSTLVASGTGAMIYLATNVIVWAIFKSKKEAPS